MNLTNFAFAMSATLFAVVYLAAVIWLGGPLARNVAIAAAYIACLSQFIGQDPKGWRVSIYIAYAAFAASLFAFIALLAGR